MFHSSTLIPKFSSSLFPKFTLDGSSLGLFAWQQLPIKEDADGQPTIHMRQVQKIWELHSCSQRLDRLGKSWLVLVNISQSGRFATLCKDYHKKDGKKISLRQVYPIPKYAGSSLTHSQGRDYFHSWLTWLSVCCLAFVESNMTSTYRRLASLSDYIYIYDIFPLWYTM